MNNMRILIRLYRPSDPFQDMFSNGFEFRENGEIILRVGLFGWRLMIGRFIYSEHGDAKFFMVVG